MTKVKKVRKWAVQLNENRVTQRKKYLNPKKKWVCASLQSRKKTSIRQKAKRNNTKTLQKAPKKLSVANLLVKHNKEIYNHQIKRLNLLLNQSLNCPTLTQEELKILFLKYKLDGHYRPNKNLPPFKILTDSTNGTTNIGQFYDANQCTSIPDVQVVNYKTSNEAAGNLYRDIGSENQHKENLNIYRNMQTNLKHDSWKPKAVLKESNMNNKIDNNYLHIAQSPVIDSNYNHMLTSYDTQPCNNSNIFNNVQNFDQTNLNSDVNRISNTAGDHFSYNSMNGQSILPDDQSYRYENESLVCSLPNTSLNYENVTSSFDMPQQNNMQCPMQSNNLWNQNLCNNFHSNNWNNNVSSMNNSNVQSWNSGPIYTYNSNLESYYYKNFSEGQSNFNSNVNVFHSMDSDSMPYAANSNVNSQQDFNSYYTASSTVASNNFLTDTNAFIPSYADMSDTKRDSRDYEFII